MIEAPDPNDPAAGIDPDCGCPAGLRADPLRDGACLALVPDEVRDLYREEACRLFCDAAMPADAAGAEVATALRRASLANREGALAEVLADASIRDTEVAAAAIPGIADRWGLPEPAVREAVSLVRERVLARLQAAGLLTPDNARCLLQRVRLHFRAPAPGSSDGTRRPAPDGSGVAVLRAQAGLEWRYRWDQAGLGFTGLPWR